MIDMTKRTAKRMTKRIRYQRSDVAPKTKHSTRNALIVLAVLAVALVGGLLVMWHFAQTNSKLGDAQLTQSIKAQKTTTTPTAHTKLSGHAVTTTLVFIHADDNTKALQEAKLICMDTTAKRSHFVNLPVHMRVASGEKPVGLQEFFAQHESKGSIDAVASTLGLQISHVMVVDSQGWERFLATSRMGASELLKQAPELLKTLHSDMSAPELLDFFDTARSIGRKNTKKVEAPLVANAAAGGAASAAAAGDAGQDTDNNQVVVDNEKLGLLVGTLVEQ